MTIETGCDVSPATKNAIQALILAALYDGANAYNGAHPRLAAAHLALVREIRAEIEDAYSLGKTFG